MLRARPTVCIQTPCFLINSLDLIGSNKERKAAHVQDLEEKENPCLSMSRVRSSSVRRSDLTRQEA